MVSDMKLTLWIMGGFSDAKNYITFLSWIWLSKLEMVSYHLHIDSPFFFSPITLCQITVWHKSGVIFCVTGLSP